MDFRLYLNGTLRLDKVQKTALKKKKKFRYEMNDDSGDYALTPSKKTSIKKLTLVVDKARFLIFLTSS